MKIERESKVFSNAPYKTQNNCEKKKDIGQKELYGELSPRETNQPE